MTPDEVRIVQRTMVRLREDPERFTAAFYRRLFELDPRCRELFPADLAVLQRKFFEQLSLIVESITDLPSLLARTEVHGRNHRTYGVRSHDYVAAGDAFVGAVREVLGDGAEAPVLAAWRNAWDVVAEAMQAGALRDPAVP